MLFKSQFSRRQAPQTKAPKASLIAKRERGIWQRRFWEHQIRDELDLQQHIDYVHYNPVKHALVSKVADWPYSTFHRYVRDGIYDDDWGASLALQQLELGE
jgi:putative transposase